MVTLSVWTPHDGLLACVAPLGLAAAAETALMVDLDPAGPRYPGELSLADLVKHGPRRVDLTPPRTGLAVLRNGGVPSESAGDLASILAALSEGWPNVVLRLPSGQLEKAQSGNAQSEKAQSEKAQSGAAQPEEGRSEQSRSGIVPVIPVLPGPLAVEWAGPAVRQPTGLAVARSSLGVTLPRPRRSTLAALLAGTRPGGRWVRAWKPVWELPW